MSFFSRLFSQSREGRCDPFKIVEAYGKVLEEAPRSLGGARPLDSLPFDKLTIKNAILEIAKANRGQRQMIEPLEAGFVSLAYFQEGVEVGSFDKSDLDEVIARLRLDCDIEDVGKQIDRLTDSFSRHSAAIESEIQLLGAEWDLEVGQNA